MLGLKRGEVTLCDHEKEWELLAKETIAELRKIFGDSASDIQHIGSTSIKTIKAKPIIDIAVAVCDFDSVLALERQLERAGFYHRPENDMPWQIFFACGSLYDGTGELQTHFIHVVLSGSEEWTDYISFRNYLNKNQSVAKEYETLKVALAEKFPMGESREKYTDGKHEFIVHALQKAIDDSIVG